MKTNFDNIPEGATDKEINMYLKAFLNEKDDMLKEKGIIYTLEQLEKIAENENYKFYNGYETAYINEIKNFIEKNLDYNNYELMNIVLTIVIQMHLDSIWNKIIKEKDLSNQGVIELIEDAKKENSKFKYFPNEEDKKRALELIDLMKKEGLKGTYKIQGEFIDGNYFDVIWEKSEIAKFGILFHAHGGDDVIQWKVCYNDVDEYKYQEDLSTDTNDELIIVLEEFNKDNYIITWTGLFGKKHEECIYDKNIDKYKNNKKYNIYKF